MSQTPLELLTAIAAPALITNASSVLVLSTSNRFARAVDRSRTIASIIAKSMAAGDERTLQIYEYKIAKQRTRTLVRALTSFYLAVASFAFGSFAGLIGTGLETLKYEGVGPSFTAVALGAVTIGTLAIATGAALLVHETRLALHGLSIEAGSIKTESLTAELP
jgi:hypothetical protein